MTNRLIRSIWPARPLATIDPLSGEPREDVWAVQDAERRWVHFWFIVGNDDRWLERQPDGVYWVWHWHRGEYCCVASYGVMGGNVTILELAKEDVQRGKKAP